MPAPRNALAGSFLAMLIALAATLATDEIHLAPKIDYAPPGQPINVQVIEKAKSLLSDSWVTDGKHGVFIEHAWNREVTPFSLYDTYWNVRLARQTGKQPDLNTAAVRLWLAGALGGRQAGSGMPAIAQIAYATELHTILGITPNRGAISASLQALATGGRYRTGYADITPNWGSTAIAIRTLTSLGMPVSRELVKQSVAALRAAADSVIVAELINELLPLLQIVASTESEGDLPEGLLERMVKRMSVLLNSTQKDSVWLLAWTSLTDVAESLGVGTAIQHHPRCDQIGTDAAAASSHDPPDPQLLYSLAAIGCSKAAPIAGHSRAGWPTPAAMSDAMRATVAGLRLAKEAGVSDKYTAGIRRSLDDVWLPGELPQNDPSNHLNSLARQARLRELCASVGGCSGVRWPVLDTSPTRLTQMSVFELFLTMSAAHYSRKDGGIAAVPRAVAQELLLRRTTPDSATYAAALEIASRTTGDRALHDAAVVAVERLHRGKYVYRSAESSASAVAVSLTSSVVGVWVSRAAGDFVSTWTAAGLCVPALVCVDGPGDLTTGVPSVSLRMLAVIAACLRPGCGEDYPIPF